MVKKQNSSFYTGYRDFGHFCDNVYVLSMFRYGNTMILFSWFLTQSNSVWFWCLWNCLHSAGGHQFLVHASSWMSEAAFLIHTLNMTLSYRLYVFSAFCPYLCCILFLLSSGILLLALNAFFSDILCTAYWLFTCIYALSPQIRS